VNAILVAPRKAGESRNLPSQVYKAQGIRTQPSKAQTKAE
jgi:hypothetical protein